jgi:hypothetical protein
MVTLFGVPLGPLHQGTFLGELYNFTQLSFFHEKMISPIPLRDFAFSGSQKLKNLLASQGRRLKAGVAKDLGGVHPEERDVAVTPQCGGIRCDLRGDSRLQSARGGTQESRMIFQHQVQNNRNS